MGVYKRDSGFWYWCRQLPDGRFIRKSTGVKDKKTAEEIYAKKLIDIAKGTFFDKVEKDKLAFRNFADDFLEQYSKPKKISWKKCDAVYLRRFKDCFGDMQLADISQEMIERYLARRKDTVVGHEKDGSPKHLAPATLNRELACLKTMFSKAIEWGKVLVNPCAKVKKLRENNERTRFLTEDEMRRLYEIASVELRQILAVLLQSGMRKGELQNLKWENLDFNNAHISLTKTKSGKVRHIPMTVAVKQVLLQRRLNKKSDMWVFPGKKGKPYDFGGAFETVRVKAGLKDVRLHDIRHTFASNLAMRGADMMTIKELLGHSSLKMTERYSHLTSKHKVDAMARLESNFGTHITPISQSQV